MNSEAYIGNAGSNPSAGTMINVAALQQNWTPDRAQRLVNGERKIRSAEDGLFRGGDFVLNKDGGACTLSFCFEYKSQTYGLTVGHLAADVGDSIFRFSASEPIPHDDDDGESYFMNEIGNVVSKSQETDSLVFLIDSGVHCSIMTLAPESGLCGRLGLPLPSGNPAAPNQGSVLVGYGAQRRGGYGTVHTPAKADDGTFSRVGNIGIVSSEGEDCVLTDDGDCGTLFLNVDGMPLYFHHTLFNSPAK